MHAYSPQQTADPMAPPPPQPSVVFDAASIAEASFVSQSPLDTPTNGSEGFSRASGISTRPLLVPVARKRKDSQAFLPLFGKRTRARGVPQALFRAEKVTDERRARRIAKGLARVLERRVLANEEHSHGRKFPGPVATPTPGAPIHVQAYASRQFPDGSASVFYSLVAPDCTMEAYAHRIVSSVKVSRSVFAGALVLLDRALEADDALAVCTLNVHRLLATAVAIANKALEDDPIRNSTMARIGGIPSTTEMNSLESHFLERIGWDTRIDAAACALYDFHIARAV